MGLRDEVLKEEEKMKIFKRIMPANSQVVKLRKKDGIMRYCIDYQWLIKVTQSHTRTVMLFPIRKKASTAWEFHSIFQH